MKHNPRLTYHVSRFTYHVLGLAEHGVEGDSRGGLLQLAKQVETQNVKTQDVTRHDPTLSY